MNVLIFINNFESLIMNILFPQIFFLESIKRFLHGIIKESIKIQLRHTGIQTGGSFLKYGHLHEQTI